MSEWLGKARVEKEDLDKDFPSLTKYFPMLGKFYVDNQRMRIYLPLEHEMAEKFKAVLVKKYGKVTPKAVREATLEAISDYIAKSA